MIPREYCALVEELLIDSRQLDDDCVLMRAAKAIQEQAAEITRLNKIIGEL